MRGFHFFGSGKSDEGADTDLICSTCWIYEYIERLLIIPHKKQVGNCKVVFDMIFVRENLILLNSDG